MAWIDGSGWYGGALKPKDGESYAAFVDRCIPALKALEPNLTDELARSQVEDAWGAYVLNKATEATITIKRELFQSDIYLEAWAGDWKITEVHSATLPTVTYSALEKARVDSGDMFRVAKSVDEKQIVFGWANVAKNADGSYPLDWDGDVTAPEELENAAYTFVLKYRETGEQHQGEAVGQMVESMMFTKEKMEALGIPEGILPEAWWVGFYLPDKEVFAKVKKGEYDMFSVQGLAKKIPTGQ